MKKAGLFISALFFGLIAFSQENTSGKIIYEQTVKFEIKLEGEAAQFASQFPKERKSEMILYFNDQEALYQNNTAAKDDEMEMHAGGPNVMIRMVNPENKVFTDLALKKQIEMREFMTRLFLIDGEVHTSWKITGNQKMILNYPCQEATSIDGEKKIVAWFTPAIPVSVGPGKYGGLPGLILAVDLDEGKNITLAKSIDLVPVSKDKIGRPEKGKKVTRDEFDKIVAEKMKETGGNARTSGQSIMIRIQK
ncbi:MAG: GLPGLI family protein [Prolixibacteraceae bacterium]